MKNITLIEGETFEPLFRQLGHMEFTRKVLYRCKDKRMYGLTGTIKITDVEPSKRIYLENEDGEAFTIRYFIDHTCERYWEASYTIYKDCPVTGSGISISAGWARAKYCYIEDSE